jgi:hypothetical protein
MNEFSRKLRMWLARKLVGGLGILLVRRSEAEHVFELCADLEEYAITSGALTSPPRIKAQRRVRAMTSSLHGHAARLVIQGLEKP